MPKRALLTVGLLLAGFMLFTAAVGLAAPPDDPTAVPTPTPTATAPFFYTVQPGDTLWDIARRYRVPLADLLAANGLRGDGILAVGQKLLIPPTGTRSGSTTAAVTAAPVVVEHRVRSGDTLWGIAVAYGVMVEDLLRANRLDRESILSVGQVVRVPSPRRLPTTPTPTPVTATETITATTAAMEPSGDEPPVDEAAPTDAATPPAPEAIAPIVAELPPAIADWPQRVLAGLNAKREAHGLPPLQWSPLLAQAAQAHADDCSRRGWCSHVGSDGARLRTRLARVGYLPAYAGENWVYARSPEAAVAWWYNEPPGRDPHRRNILSPRYTEVGIGIAVGVQGHYYFIADFGRP
ncbi:MAG: LysM peptidoglycan-binding domain-containing protein [Gemmataceae bacterium]|nr:LysM peptidoglycan-binding domain-containing protein [Caldilineales bacterium]MDW8264074.1 LysM peptidoglycan-binding domain-containing protein [Gemmataceae bacterium]